MRSVIRNIRILLTDPENYDARSELAWASAMAENGVLKIGKVTDFQAHQIEHQLGATPIATMERAWRSPTPFCTATSTSLVRRGLRGLLRMSGHRTQGQ